jgi:hypothetical protein
MQRGLVAEPARRWPGSSRRAAATRGLASAIDARRRTSMAEVSLLVHRARPERDGQRRGEDGVKVCGTLARARGEPYCAVGDSCTAPTRVGRSNAEPPRVIGRQWPRPRPCFRSRTYNCARVNPKALAASALLKWASSSAFAISARSTDLRSRVAATGADGVA